MAQLLRSLRTVGFASGLAGLVGYNCLFTVDPGHRAIKFKRFQGGVHPKVYDEGTHLFIPVVESPILMDVRTRPRSVKTQTASKDLQNVNLTLRVLSKPEVGSLAQIYQTLGLDYDERVLPSMVNEVLKGTVAQYNADQLLTQRDKVSMEIRQNLKSRLDNFNIKLDDVSITHLNFSKDFSKAIEDKQVASQQAERAKFIVMKAEQERQANVIQAEGDSEAAELIGNAVKKHGPGLVMMRKIETAQDISKTLSHSRNVTYLPSGKDGGSNLLLNLKNQ
mmetsp:Transcript_16739/g.41225  ORF Transcript_16739/g.41225 Transcript_16739/m.41225 type:complete len:278 (-) Transcript_16739:304-1137(-)